MVNVHDAAVFACKDPQLVREAPMLYNKGYTLFVATSHIHLHQTSKSLMGHSAEIGRDLERGHLSSLRLLRLTGIMFKVREWQSFLVSMPRSAKAGKCRQSYITVKLQGQEPRAELDQLMSMINQRESV